jgi:nicotinate-nucleotide adenylyltransferase
VNIAIFGGTFDPVHSGHLVAARAAQTAFSLDQIHFVPARVPPHKRTRHLTAFAHRYAMVALACAGTAGFFPSLLDAGEAEPAAPTYSITTVRRMRALLSPADRLHYLIGADAFLDIGQWNECVALLDEADFIVVSRPGFSIARVAEVIPPQLRASALSDHTIELRRTSVHLLTTVEADISSSEIRILAAQGKSICKLVPEAVGEYIRKLSLYQNEEPIE